MKFSISALSMLAMAPLGVLSSATTIEESVELSKFSVEATFPKSEGAAVAQLFNDNETPVSFKFTNKEDFPIHVAAFDGSFTYKGKDTPYSNLTTVEVGPILLEANGEHTLHTALKVTLPPQDFDLGISFLCAFEGGMSAFELDPIAVTVSDPPISFWDPKLILANLILALTVLSLGYVGSISFVIPYFEEKQKAAAVKKPVVEAEPQASGVVLNDKGYDESWIPQHHLNADKKTRKTKNN